MGCAALARSSVASSDSLVLPHLAMRVAYLFTSFPKLSERFFLREVVALKRLGLSLSIYSMIGGSADSEAGPVRRFSPIDWLRIIPESLYWMWVRPAACQTILIHFLQARFGSWTNFGENSLGLAFALRFARQFRDEGYDYVHATWPRRLVWRPMLCSN